MKAHDGIIVDTDLSRQLMAKFDNSAATIVDWSETANPSDYAEFAPLVIEAAACNDSIATKIKATCLQDYQDILSMLINKGANKISLIGGLSETYLHWLDERYLPYLRKPIGDPIDGAIIMAKKYIPEQ